jgi:hypothetical protein
LMMGSGINHTSYSIRYIEKISKYTIYDRIFEVQKTSIYSVTDVPFRI